MRAVCRLPSAADQWHRGVVTSSRCNSGGYRLRLDPEKARVLEVIEAIDGLLPDSACLPAWPVCRPGACIFRELHENLRRQVTTAGLGGIRLIDSPLQESLNNGSGVDQEK